MATSLLDGFPKSEQDVRAIKALSEQILDDTLERADLSPRDRSVAELLRKGLSLADIFQITPRQRDALLAQGCRLLQIGKIAAAKDALLTLVQLDPLDERAIYALAACHQASGAYEEAGRLYLSFIALNATNPDGYLRLGECFLANGETDKALECFESVRATTAGKRDKAAQHAHALTMLALTNERRTDA